MREFLKNNAMKNLLSAVLFGLIYSVFSLLDEGYVEVGRVLGTSVCYFLIMCLLYFVAPKLRKITGHDQKKN